MDIYIARTQGFCAGVASAIDIVDYILDHFDTTLYVYHDIVHNTSVVKELKDRGVLFVEDINDVPDGERIVFSAHGIPPNVLQAAKDKNLKYIDATCPLVTKVHKEAIKFSSQNIDIVLIGHRGHQELIGTAGYVDKGLLHIVETEHDIDLLTIDSDKPVAYITQTTLSVDETQGLIDKLHRKFPKLVAPARADICYATQNRQDAIKELAEFCELVIICGSPHSSNSNRLVETSLQMGVDSFIIDTADELDVERLSGKESIGISSGASVPRYLVDQIIDKIQSRFTETTVHTFKNPEKNIKFRMPEIV